MNINRLTQKAQEADLASQALARRNGQPEVGKTAIVEDLAQRIVRGDVPEALEDRIAGERKLIADLAGMSGAALSSSLGGGVARCAELGCAPGSAGRL
jgi:ATP-dependent Clp protease ATP-binding subunit ClpA